MKDLPVLASLPVVSWPGAMEANRMTGRKPAMATMANLAAMMPMAREQKTIRTRVEVSR